MKCLIVEDDPVLAGQLAGAMRDGGFACDLAAEGTQGEFLGATESYDLAIFDLKECVVNRRRARPVEQARRQQRRYRHRLPSLSCLAHRRSCPGPVGGIIALLAAGCGALSPGRAVG